LRDSVFVRPAALTAFTRVENCGSDAAVWTMFFFGALAASP
jgi:hypothetical protein